MAQVGKIPAKQVGLGPFFFWLMPAYNKEPSALTPVSCTVSPLLSVVWATTFPLRRSNATMRAGSKFREPMKSVSPTRLAILSENCATASPKSKMIGSPCAGLLPRDVSADAGVTAEVARAVPSPAAPPALMTVRRDKK